MMFSTDEWSGRTGDAWADEWRRTDRSFSGLAGSLNAAILAVAPETGRAIDLGCGAGDTAIALAKARPSLAVSGIDISPGLVAVAVERGAGCGNLDFRVGDTAMLPAESRADLFFSRHGVMFFVDPVAAFSRVRAAAMSGAPLVFSCFRDRSTNRWAMLGDALTGADTPPAAGYVPGPFGFADRAFVADMLGRAGWTEVRAEAVDFRYIAGAGADPVADALGLFTRIGPVARTIADRPANERPMLTERLAELLSARVHDGRIEFDAAAWIWTAKAGEVA